MNIGRAAINVARQIVKFHPAGSPGGQKQSHEKGNPTCQWSGEPVLFVWGAARLVHQPHFPGKWDAGPTKSQGDQKPYQEIAENNKGNRSIHVCLILITVFVYHMVYDSTPGFLRPKCFSLRPRFISTVSRYFANIAR